MNSTSYTYYNPHLTVKKSIPALYAATGLPSFQTAHTLPVTKPRTAGWLDRLDLFQIEHYPYSYNPRGGSIEPIFTDWQPWPGIRVRSDF